MRKVLFLLLLVSFSGLILCVTACSKERAVNTKPVTSFNLSRYLGEWYEIARFDHSFEKGMEFTMANYILNDDGTVRVENTGYKNGKFKMSVGKAKCPNPADEPARLRVSFFGPFYSDYRVLMLDEDYQYSLVSSKGDGYLWILSRTPEMPAEQLSAMLSEAQRRGFDTSRLIYVKQK